MNAANLLLKRGGCHAALQFRQPSGITHVGIPSDVHNLWAWLSDTVKKPQDKVQQVSLLQL